MTTYIESEAVELKSKFTDLICKAIVAFLNSNGSDVIIGVDDSGKVVGLKDPDETSKKVSDISQIKSNRILSCASRQKYDLKKDCRFSWRMFGRGNGLFIVRRNMVTPRSDARTNRLRM